MKQTVLITISLLSYATLVHAQNEALYIDKTGNVNITKLVMSNAISFDNPIRSISIMDRNPGREMRFTNSMNGNNDNAQGGFNFTDNNGKTVVRINDYKVCIGADDPKSTLDVRGRIRDEAGFVTPKGGIIMWSGSKDLFDADGRGKPNTDVEGWAICNGNKNTGAPDLRDKFIVAAGGKYNVGGTGGKDEITLSKGQMPRHSHQLLTRKKTDQQEAGWSKYSINSVIMTDHEGQYRRDAVKVQNGGLKDAEQNFGSPFVGEEGGNEAFDNRPAYYALLYIIKL